jgi:DNA modification methylase
LNALTSLLNTVVHGDCLDVMRALPNESIDMVVADPPYLVKYLPRDRRTVANDQNNAWLRPAFAEMYRVLKPNTFCVSFYGWPEVDQFMATWKRVGFSPVSHIVCLKEYASRTGYTRSFHEVLYLLAKGRPPRRANPIGDVLRWQYTGNPLHPTQKPVAVVQTLIETFSKPGDVVLDPFAGSGTTGVAAWNCGRQFILIEKVWHHWRNAHNRTAGQTPRRKEVTELHLPTQLNKKEGQHGA